MVSAASKERSRAAKIVRRYRDELVAALHAKPLANNAAQVVQVIRRLEEIEEKIRNVPIENKTPPDKMPTIDGFSMDEMELAEQIMAEQNSNPFEDVS